MKTFWAIILGLFLLVGCGNNNTDTLGNWVKKSAFEGAPRGQAVSFVIGDRAYVGLGYNVDYETGDPNISNEGYKKDFWMYNPSNDTWTSIARFPGAGRTNAVAFAANGKGYVTTGWDGDNRLADTWEYDPTTDKWTQKDDYAGGARRYAVAFTINNYGYVGTGSANDGSDKNEFYKFDPTAAAGSQWIKVASLGDKRRGATAFVYNGKAYVCTGITDNTRAENMYEYDPSIDLWTKKTKITDNSDWTVTRENASSFVLDSKAYVFLGQNSSNLKTCWEYDFAKDTWNEKNEFEGGARQYAVAFSFSDGKAIVTTGEAGTSYYFDDVWEFRPYEELNEDDN